MQNTKRVENHLELNKPLHTGKKNGSHAA